MLNLAEELLLLTLVADGPEPSRLIGVSGLTPHTLRGALLSELLVRGKLRIEGDRLTVVDPTPTGEALADHALTEVSGAPSPLRVGQALGRMGGCDDLLERASRRLVEKGIVRMEGRRGWLGRQTDIPRLETREEAEHVREALREAALGSGTPSPRVLALMGLLRHCGLWRRLLSKGELRGALPRIRELTQDDPVRKAVQCARIRKDLLDAAFCLPLLILLWAPVGAGGPTLPQAACWAVPVLLAGGGLYVWSIRRE
jgi:hypothetical protein